MTYTISAGGDAGGRIPISGFSDHGSNHLSYGPITLFFFLAFQILVYNQVYHVKIHFSKIHQLCYSIHT